MHNSDNTVHGITLPPRLQHLILQGQQRLFTRQRQLQFFSDFRDIYQHNSVPLHILEHLARFNTGLERLVAISMLDALRRGLRLADGMEGWFDPVLVEAVRIGERNNALIDALDMLQNALGQSQKILVTAAKKLTYPVILLLFATASMFFMKEKLLMLALDMAKGDLSRFSQPMLTLWHTTHWLQTHTWWLLLLILCSVVGLSWTMHNYTGSYRQRLDQLPLFSHYRLSVGANFMQSYAILKGIHLQEMDILQQMSNTASPYYRSHLTRMRESLRIGVENFGDMIDTGLIERRNIERMHLLSQTASYGFALQEAAQTVRTKTNDLLLNLISFSALLCMMAGAIAITISLTAVLSASQVFQP